MTSPDDANAPDWTPEQSPELMLADATRCRRLVDGDADDFEEVDFERLERGDRVLCLPGERLPVHGVVRAVRRWDAHSASFVGTGTGTEADATPALVERERPSPDEGDELRTDSRPVAVGDEVEPGDRPTETALVVEYRPSRAGLFPIPLSLASLLSAKLLGTLSPRISQVAGRLVIVFVVVGIVLVGTGLAAPGSVDRFLDDSGINDAISDLRGGDDPGPSPPDVTVTPPSPTSDTPPNEDDEDEDTPTPASTPTATTTSNPTPSSPTPTPAPTSSPEPTTTARSGTDGGVGGGGGGGGGGRGGGGGGGRGGGGGGSQTTTTAASSASPDPTLSVGAADPPTVRSADGTVGTLSGPVTGTLSWTGAVDSVVLVVNAWVPDEGWQEERRVTVRESSPVDIAAALGSDVTYADGNRTAGFAASDDGETAVTTGYVSVTAVLFRGSTEVARTEETASFDVTVENTAGSAPEGVDLELGSGGAGVSLLDTQSVAPGSAGNSTGTLTNRGRDPGVLTLDSMPFESAENGRSGPELSVDSTGGADEGELHEALAVRLRVERANGTSTYVLGDETTYLDFADVWNESVSLGRLDGGESLSLVVEWQIRESAGNEIQTDSVDVEFVFTLEQATD
ncbi:MULTISPECIES: hypothetical protein [unclassified Haloferax]|uniref:hypothetical protein n=1 Tax=unclassified Haloferax TaxID=2625095 RepID=UPI002875C54C|nr:MULTISPECIES: hypothetical protein [unclassified Haloferax]MDS0241714.1 hypothetical protein [Haloferax sp. S2CR25]MDS0444835.1 hypothetical protein [Haloferax sp. S2CR25-2]